MPDYLIYILLGLNIIILIMSVAKIVKDNSKKESDDREVILKELQKQESEMNLTLGKISTALEINMRNIEENQKERLDNLEKEVLKGLKDVDERSEKMRVSVEQNLKFMNDQNEKSMEKMRNVVDEKLSETLESRLAKSFEVINKSLSEVNQGLGDMQTLAKDVGSLKNVLQNVKVRGTWAEIQLEALLSEMLTTDQFDKQVQTKPGSGERVDFCINLPGKNDKVLLPIDSKFPVEDYNLIVEFAQKGDVDNLEKARKALEIRIKDEAKSISAKYINVPRTTDFAIMYLPTEGLYAEVVKNDELTHLVQRDYRVIICGPSTLGALLSSLQMGFKTVAIEKKSSDILKMLLVFKTEFGKFTDLLQKTKSKIDDASNTIDMSLKRTEIITKKLSKVESDELLEGETTKLIDM